MRTTLVSGDELAAHLDDPAWRIFDCRHDLQDTAYGEKAYAKGHIPGALFLHLDRDLSGEKTGGNGRHPLPSREAFAATMAACGVGPDTQVVAYDNEGSIFASRLWWMLRWAGHEKVAVLDGGVPGWRRAKREFEIDVRHYAPAPFVARHGTTPFTADDVLERLDDRRVLILDARAPERFSGEEENLDPVGGHIPGAVNRFYFDNLDDAGCFFKTAEELREEFDGVLAGREPQNVIQQCGSGVTACHNLLAMEVAGLNGSQLYVGSWSEWCADPSRPIATGE
ncbi:MAG: sulfurtransferase [Gammaproteobacteria bacterium]|nr:sulfurtransferase [Gammaproteobacteria bacterium]MBU1647118.1 sulfurtransferase [Gammaproteobacteria bacterium]MBU1972630.1 sulfurtransferase [Gammaproteobacteria bacterium]